MKIPFRDIEAFVKKPNPAARVILIYGPDSGLMSERAKTIGTSVVPNYNDPFNVAVLSSDSLSDDPARLADEANAISMMGGNRLIRVEDAGDKITTLVKDYLENPNDAALVLLQAGELGPRSSLRKLCEAAKNAAALPCYVEDERDLSRFIRQEVQNASLAIDPDAVTWLASNIGGDRQKARMEMEKLLLYKGKVQSAITIDEARQACGESGAQGLDDLIYAVASRRGDQAMRSYQKLMEEGMNFIVVLRALQNHFRRLHITKSRLANGENGKISMKKLQPPVFFKQESEFLSQCDRWSEKALEAVLGRLADIEADCKTTGMPAETLCAQAILGLSASRK